MRLIHVILLVFCVVNLQAKRIYVSDQGNDANDGCDWSSAFESLSFALCQASDEDEIWISQGTYKPKFNSSCIIADSAQVATFYIEKSISIYGGLPIGATSLEEQDTDQIITTLTGGIPDLSDNSYNVMTIAGGKRVILSGLVIRDGYANGSTGSNNIFGGGLFVRSGDGDLSLDILKCTFTNNRSANSGGAMRLTTSLQGNLCVLIDQCIFDDNESESIAGAISVRPFTEPINMNVVNCVFNNNFADASGGAISISSAVNGIANVDFNHCTFVNNTADAFGGVLQASPASDGGPIAIRMFQSVSSGSTGFGTFFLVGSNASMEFFGCAIQEHISCAEIGIPGNFSCFGDMIYGLDPQFVDTLNNDFRLRLSSPLIDRGEETNYNNCEDEVIDIINDIAGAKRDAPYDYGAYEYRCIENLSLSGALSSGAYVVSNEISTDGIVGDSTVLDAGESIVLDFNFEVADQAVLEVQISGCDN